MGRLQSRTSSLLDKRLDVQQPRHGWFLDRTNRDGPRSTDGQASKQKRETSPRPTYDFCTTPVLPTAPARFAQDHYSLLAALLELGDISFHPVNVDNLVMPGGRRCRTERARPVGANGRIARPRWSCIRSHRSSCRRRSRHSQAPALGARKPLIVAKPAVPLRALQIAGVIRLANWRLWHPQSSSAAIEFAVATVIASLARSAIAACLAIANSASAKRDGPVVLRALVPRRPSRRAVVLLLVRESAWGQGRRGDPGLCSSRSPSTPKLGCAPPRSADRDARSFGAIERQICFKVSLPRRCRYSSPALTLGIGARG